MRDHILEVAEDTATFLLSDPDEPFARLIVVGVYKSAGVDGAWVVQIDTTVEPDALPLRINLNDGIIHGPEYSDE